jgi:hypothetical protein
MKVIYLAFALSILGSCAPTLESVEAKLIADELCTSRKDTNYCTPVGACLAGTEVLFQGQSFGRFKGPVVGKLSTGHVCEGTWSVNVVSREGQSDVSCTNGLDIKVRYVRVDRSSGTIFGIGKTQMGQTVAAWSGLLARAKPLSNELNKERFAEACRLANQKIVLSEQ